MRSVMRLCNHHMHVRLMGASPPAPLQGDLDAAINARSRQTGARVFDCKLERLWRGVGPKAFKLGLGADSQNSVAWVGRRPSTWPLSGPNSKLLCTALPPMCCVLPATPPLQGTTGAGGSPQTLPAAWPVSWWRGLPCAGLLPAWPVRGCCWRAAAMLLQEMACCVPLVQEGSCCLTSVLVQTCTAAGCCIWHRGEV